jgi:hypothetical protein
MNNYYVLLTLLPHGAKQTQSLVVVNLVKRWRILNRKGYLLKITIHNLESDDLGAFGTFVVTLKIEQFCKVANLSSYVLCFHLIFLLFYNASNSSALCRLFVKMKTKRK